MPSKKDVQRISFHYLQKFSFSNRTLAKTIVLRILREAGLKAENISYVFCSDEYLLNINRHHLEHDYYTDIITFDLSERKGAVIADVYVSVDRVRENASEFNKSFQDELLRVIFHGALHLAGLGDKSPRQQARMRAAEERYLRMFHKQAHVPRDTVS
ncbi:MAG TPA: rRNA maturation RNase YbeY [Chitinophagaceae bacterium]|nr:rRNA maturation RNase YbeY [Chitinophagaceae bacterium]